MYGDILITQLNDFIFCPASIYFHNLYGETERFLYQSESQINGTAAHSAIDQHTYSDRKNIYCAMDVYSEKYGLRGKIDIYDVGSCTLIERKNKSRVYMMVQLYGFDVYQGVYHKEFYMRKSLVCDLMDPMRPLIDYKVRKAINLKQCKQEDFKVYYNSQWTLIPQKIPAYIGFLMEEILDNKEEMFLFIQSYYRSFMKGRPVEEYRMFNLQ